MPVSTILPSQTRHSSSVLVLCMFLDGILSPGWLTERNTSYDFSASAISLPVLFGDVGERTESIECFRVGLMNVGLPKRTDLLDLERVRRGVSDAASASEAMLLEYRLYFKRSKFGMSMNVSFSLSVSLQIFQNWKAENFLRIVHEKCDFTTSHTG